MFCSEEDLPAVLTFEETREYLYISRGTLLKLLHEGTLKGFKAGNQWRIRKEDLIEFTKKMIGSRAASRKGNRRPTLFCRLST